MRTKTFETKNLILREIEPIDANDFYEFASLYYIGPIAGWAPHTSLSYTKEVIKYHRRKQNYGQLPVFSIVLKETEKMIGTIELHEYTKNFKAELGFTVNPNYWGKGYAVEASKKIIEWGFSELNLKRIECAYIQDNTRSKRVCEKLSFKYEGLKRKGFMLYNNHIFDLETYAMTDEDYNEIKKQWIE